MKHTKRAQNSTVAGGVTLVGTILLIFGDIELQDTFSEFAKMDWNQISPLLLIVGGALRSIFIKEKTGEKDG